MFSPGIAIRQVTHSQIPTLAHISSLAFAKDTHTLLKTLSTGTDHAGDMTAALTSWMSRPRSRCQVITAVHESEKGEKEVMGWACWAFKGFDGPPFDDEEGDEGKEERGEGEDTTAEGVVGGTKEKPEGIQSLEEITNGSMISWSNKLSPAGSENVILCAITVHPSYQGKGVGKALINYGLEIADQEGVYCWVHASEAGWRVFEKLGFAEVGRLSVDLDKFSGGVRCPLAGGGKGEEGKWGEYVFRYMRREAGGGGGAT